MNLSVIQTENFENDPAALGCYIMSENTLIDIITPISSNNQENFTEIPNSGTIEFTIKDMRKDEILGTLVTEAAALPSSGSKWFELVSDLVPTPRILISFNNFSQEVNNNRDLPIKEELLSKINELSTMIMDLECKLAQEKESKQREIESYKKILCNLKISSELTIEQLHIKISGYVKVIEQLTLQNSQLGRLCEKEHGKSFLLEAKLNALESKYDDIHASLANNDDINKKDNTFLSEELIKTKESLCSELSNKISREALISQLTLKLNTQSINQNSDNEAQIRIETLTKQLECSEKQKNLLQDLLKTQEIPSIKENPFCTACENKETQLNFLSLEISNLQKSISTLNQQKIYQSDLQACVDLQEQEIFRINSQLAESLQETSHAECELAQKSAHCQQILEENQEIIQECTELKHRVIDLTKYIETLERDVTELKCRSITAKKMERIRLDNVDYALESYLCGQGIENLFVKLAHGVYLYGTKRVNISIRNDNHLICRTGGGYTSIDQFLKMYQNTEIEDMSKYVKKQSLFLSQGSSPLRGIHKKACSATPENRSYGTSPKEVLTERKLETKIIDKLRQVYPLKEKNQYK